MNLREFQEQIEGGLTAPLSCRRSTERLRTASELIKPNSQLSAFERLDIYRRSYWARLLDSLADDFPGLSAVLGKRAFRVLSEAYLSHSPSSSFTLRDLGSRLAPFLLEHPQYAGSHPALALDVACLEWAHIEAYDSAAELPLGPEDRVEIDLGLHLALQPHLRLLQLTYPVDDWLIRLQSRSADQHRRLFKSACRKMFSEPQPIFLAVHRSNDAVYYRRLAPAEYRILSAFQLGRTIEQAVTAAGDCDPTSIEAWFKSWSLSEWLCRGR